MKTTRRKFIKLAAVPMITAPFILPSRVWMYPPSDRITMGFVGMGKQSQWLLSKFLPLTQVLAVCDVDTTRRDNSQKIAKKFYYDNKDKGVADCKVYNDGSGQFQFQKRNGGSFMAYKQQKRLDKDLKKQYYEKT